MPRKTKNPKIGRRKRLAPLLHEAQQAESEARRELRAFRRIAATAAAELGAAFERLGAARARVATLRGLEALRSATGRKGS
jgi:hypothetical protein